MGALSTPSLTYGVVAGLLVRGGVRLYDACRLLKYQYELHVLPEYRISSHDIPVSKTDLFLGRGFEWRVRHTQRRADIDRQEFDYHKDRPRQLGYRLARQTEVLMTKAGLHWMTRVTGQKAWWNPVAPIPYTEGVAAIHAVGLWEGESNTTIKQAERVAHTFVVGTTRVGKTRLAEVAITQDIHNGDIVITFDPKGDADLLKRMYVEAKKAGRLHQFYCFHLGYPAVSARYNPVGSFGRITEPASRVASQLPGEGSSAAFREFTWRYVNVMSKALMSIGKTITYENLLRYGGDIDPLLSEYLAFILDQPASEKPLVMAGIHNWRQTADQLREIIKPDKTQASRDKYALALVQIYKQVNLTDPTAGALIKTFEYEKSFYDKLVASLFPLLEKLTSGPAGELLSPDYFDLTDKRPIFDWDTVIRTGGIVYVGLDALSDAEVSQAVGASMFSDLTSRAGEIYKHGVNSGLPDELAALATKRKICVHADEFNELVGKEFVPMANKAGGAGFQLTVYTQTLSDIEARFGSAAKAGQVIGNLGNLIMLRVKEKKTAELLTDLLPDVEINHLMSRSSAQDDVNPDTSTDFTSGTQQQITTQRVPMISAGDLTRLPKGQAFGYLGGKLFKIRMPLFSNESELPANLDFLYTDMKKRYSTASTNENWFRIPDVQLKVTL